MRTEPARVRKARAALVALFALFLLPVIGSVVLVIAKPGWTPFGTVNRGELIDPPPGIDLARARDVAGGKPLTEIASGKWLLVHLSTVECGEPCARALVAMRQARIALGPEAGRVERVWLVTGAVAADKMREVLDAFPGLHAFIASNLAELFPRPVGDAVYVVDPAGLLILRYEGTQSASDLLKDMKRLLKISKQG